MKLSQIEKSCNSGAWEHDDTLYLATEAQIDKLISQGKIDEDFGSRKQDADEEMRCLMADAMTNEALQLGIMDGLKGGNDIADIIKGL